VAAHGFEDAVALALAPALARALVAPARTAIVADPAEPERVAAALPALLGAMRAAGVRGGGTFVLAAADRGRTAAAEIARRWREAAGVPVVRHDPDHSASCRIVRDESGEWLPLDDELRESEAIVLVGGVRLAANGTWEGGSRLIVPGLSPAGAAAAADVAARAAVERLGVDLALLWSESGAGATGIWCAPGLAAEDRARAHARGA
jgi:nickel-dependent lactate racemase